VAILLAILLSAVLLRVYRIDYQSVWADEAFSLVASELPLREMTERLILDFVHPPLYYYTLHFWFQVVGFGALQARLVSLIFGSLTVVMVYRLARYLFETRTAVLAAVLVSVSQLAVTYSQEARPYAMGLFFSVCSAYLFLVATRERRAAAWWGFVGSSILMIYTHYYTVFVFVSLFCFALLFRKRHATPDSWLIGGAVVVLLAYTPWMASGVLEHALHKPKVLAGDQPFWFAAHWWTFFSTVNRFNNGALAGVLNSSPRWCFFAGAFLFTVPALLALKPFIMRSADSVRRAEREGLVFLTILWLLPLLCVIAVAAVGVQYDVRYVFHCTAPYYILVARGISGIRFPALRAVLVGLIVVYSGYALWSNYFIPYKENYRDALAYVAREYKEGDCCLFTPSGKVPLQWFIYQRNTAPPRVVDADSILSGLTSCQRVWLVAYGRVDSAIVKAEAASRGLEITHAKIAERRYFWVTVKLYELKSH
jgi:uncharacterized membrane protein